MKKLIITDGVYPDNCKYYEPVGGVEYQGRWQYTDVCYKYYQNCYNKKICPYKIIQLILHPIKIIKQFISLKNTHKILNKGLEE